MTRDSLTWFEIPVRDLDRAQTFYETLLDRPLRREAMGPHTMAVFPSAEGRVGGALLAGSEAAVPAATGTIVYLDVGPSLDATLARAAQLGAVLACPKVVLPRDLGVFAHVIDSEGNRVGLHAPA